MDAAAAAAVAAIAAAVVAAIAAAAAATVSVEAAEAEAEQIAAFPGVERSSASLFVLLCLVILFFVVVEIEGNSTYELRPEAFSRSGLGFPDS